MFSAISRWRVSSIDEMILIERLRRVLDAYFSLDAKSLNSLFLVGESGLGKSTLARLAMEHFDWQDKEHIVLTDNKWFKHDRLDTQAIASQISSIVSHGTGLSALWTTSAGRSLFVIDEIQQLTEHQQRRINEALEERADSVCVIATANTSRKEVVAKSTLSRFEVIDFDILQQKQHRDELIADMVRVAGIVLTKAEARGLLSDSDIEDIATRTHYDFRDFFKTLARECLLKSKDDS
jgi:replication-associated recombination protein RarA